MTVTHIIERLERLKSFEKCPYPIFITEEDSEVLDLAIKSLEAWEKVRKETENSIHHFSPEARSCMDHASDCMNEAKNQGIKLALDIIDKHLSEVSE